MKKADSGWSWIIICASFIEHFLFVGTINTVGIYGVYIMDKFNIGLTPMTIIGAVFTSLGFAGAIILIPIKGRFGNRPVIMVGGMLTFIGYLVSSFVSSFPLLYVTMAIIPGLGHSFAYAVLLISVDRYFDKKKFIAMAIGTVGGAVGMVALPILSEYMLSEYGYEGAILIHSALSLHAVVCGAVVFPLQTTNIDFEGGSNVGYNLSLKNLVKPTEYASALSIGLLPVGLGALVGSPLTAFIKESTGNQGTPYYIGASILVLGALLICPFSKPKITDITDVEINVLPDITDIEINVLSDEQSTPNVSDLHHRETDIPQKDIIHRHNTTNRLSRYVSVISVTYEKGQCRV